MKITFILPAIGKKPGEKYIGTWKMEPLTIAVLKSLTPAEVETAFYDDRIELIDYDDPTDIVMMTVETYTAKRSYQIAREYKKRGATVIMGGYHVTLLPDEAQMHADAIMTGNAENIYGQVLIDYAAGKLQKRYDGEVAFSHIRPDKSIFEGKKYLPISLVETGRGCGNRCEFCAIAGYYNCRYFSRPVVDIVADIKQSKHHYHFLVDDNLVADRDHVVAMCQAIEPLKIKWAAQGTLTMAKDVQLLKIMKKSGCELILIGFESLEEGNLKQMHKGINIMNEERDMLVGRIHEAGIGIYATFVFGYGFDTEEAIEKALRFCEKHKFYTTAFNHLLPFPGTPLYDRLKAEKRLLYDAWWLQDGYNYGELAFQPTTMPPEKLSMACRNARREYSNLKNTLKRGFAAMHRSSPLMWSLFWGMNLRIGGEVDQKMNVPIGGNLDAYPK